MAKFDNIGAYSTKCSYSASFWTLFTVGI